MADSTYAWSRIIYGVEKDDDGNVIGQKSIAPGDPVSQGDLGVEDDEWQLLQDQEVVREYPLPESLQDPFLSPRQIMQDKLIDAQEGFDRTGPTADLLKRFDDEGELLPAEEIEIATQAPSTPEPTQPPPSNAPSNG